MGIEQMIARRSEQVIVYWGSPVENGIGGKTFASPVEVYGRWQNQNQLLYDNKGTEYLSKSIVYTACDLQEGGMMWLGCLDDLEALVDSDQLLDPQTVPNAFFIKRIDKNPSLANVQQFNRVIYLTDVGYV